MKIKVQDEVLMPEPEHGDEWHYEFMATVIDILDNGTAIVEDQDSDLWTVEIERLKHNA